MWRSPGLSLLWLIPAGLFVLFACALIDRQTNKAQLFSRETASSSKSVLHDAGCARRSLAANQSKDDAPSSGWLTANRVLSLSNSGIRWLPMMMAQMDADFEKLRAETQKRREKAWYQKVDWFSTILMVLGIAGGVVVVVVVWQHSRKARGPKVHVAHDMIGGYRLQNLMMTGQTSQVWEVVETSSGRHFAMKFLLPEKLNDEEHRRMLYHEAEVGMELAHANVIRIMKLVKDRDNPYFLMEFFPAGNLKLRIMHKKWDFIKEHAHSIFKQAATGLAYMNASGWVHRDVKPDNIMVNSAGEVRLIDFALSQRVAKKGLFRRKKKGRAAGTRSYMSPEQIRGEPLDGRADIYSFGVSAYEIITGRPPFRAATPTELLNKHIIEKPISPQVYNPDVTDEFAALVLRMLAKKKEDRPRDFHDVLMALRNIKVFKSETLQKSSPA